MERAREHRIIVVKDEFERVVEYKCASCKAILETADEHHPESFCLLVGNGYDPKKELQR